MMNNLLLTASLSLGEKTALSGEMLLRGMGTVFLVLLILWGIIAAFGMAFSAVKSPAKKPAEKKTAPAPKTTPAAKLEPKPVSATVQTQSDDTVIAVICAAIEAYRAEEGLSGLPYRVVSFKRKSGKKSWTGSRED